MADWRRELLHMIDAPATPGNLRLLATWQRWEGGHTNNGARFNWLNTTMDAPGVTGSINSVGVKAFKDRRSGVNALAMTLLNGRYNDIVGGLRSGHPYKHDLSAGLETWVSGSPTGNPAYAAKIMGKQPGSQPAAQPAYAPTIRPPKHLDAGPPPDPMEAVYAAFSDDPSFVATLKSFQRDGQSTHPTAPPTRTVRQYAAPKPGSGIYVPENWKGTHVTDGLGWGTKTAEDIMGAPGTPVYLPEPVTVVYYHPTGAQGGGSMLVRTASGREYWLGHITEGAAAGSQIPAGKALAYISADHPRPHVHVDRRG